MLFTDLLKDDLLKAANFYKVEVEPNWTKDRIATALLDAGKTPEQWEKDAEANDVGEGNGAVTSQSLHNAEVEQPERTVEDTVEAAEEPEEKNEELVLVRFTGANQSYTSGDITVSRFRPFALVTTERFDSLDRKKFRLASKEEAAEFYNH